MCYNFGVDMYNMRKYEESSFWLRYGLHFVNLSLAKVLRLLATVFLEWDCLQFKEKALNAVRLANKECVHPSGLYLKIRILLGSGAPDEQIRSGELLSSFNAHLTFHTNMGVIILLLSAPREAVAFDLLKRVCQRFAASPDLGSALVLHIELLLQRNKELLAKQKIEDVITGHFTGRPLTPQSLICLHILLWAKASKNFEAKNYSEALQWYNYSLSFYKGGQLDPNLAKLQRNRASCFIHLQQLDRAKEAVTEAGRCDPDDIFTQFSIYKIALLENNAELGPQVLTSGPSSRDDCVLVTGNASAHLLSLAAQMALENEQQDIAVKALESLCEYSEDAKQVLTALRCLVRIVLSTIENVPEGNRCVFNREIHVVQFILLRSDQAHWFRRIAWNCALLCEASSIRMRDFFILSYQLSLLCPIDSGLLLAQKTCLFMAAACALELYRASQADLLTQALEHIQVCWEVWNKLKASDDFAKDQTDTLLLLFEFEARAKLNDPKLETVLESVLEIDNIQPKVLETVAALAMEPPAHFPLLCKKALRMALSLHRKQPHPDLTCCSQCVHSLIQLSLPSGVCEVEPRVLEEMWGYYEEALSIITGDFPELEILWLLTRAWNTGILSEFRPSHTHEHTGELK
uniref:Protein ZIP4 homolog n=1 Tax=Denticeps clupeoides TaxID=299321 RepID=A0AAY4E955_9TELE